MTIQARSRVKVLRNQHPKMGTRASRVDDHGCDGSPRDPGWHDLVDREMIVWRVREGICTLRYAENDWFNHHFEVPVADLELIEPDLKLQTDPSPG